MLHLEENRKLHIIFSEALGKVSPKIRRLRGLWREGSPERQLVALSAELRRNGLLLKTGRDSPSYLQRKKEGSALEVSLIFKIGAVGILVSVLGQVLKHSGREEQAFLTSLAGLVLVLFWVLPYIYELFETIKKLFML